MEVGLEGCLDMPMLCTCCLSLCIYTHIHIHTHTHTITSIKMAERSAINIQYSVFVTLHNVKE